MKLLTLFAAVATIAKFAYADDNAYCPQPSDGKCDATKTPSEEYKGNLVEQLKDEVDCAGTVVIDNECSFTVKDFVFKFNDTDHEVTWWGSKSFNTGIGPGNQLSKTKVEEVDEAKDTSFTTDASECWVNLNTDIGTFYLMDSENNVLCHAIVREDLGGSDNSGSSSDNTGSSNSGSDSGNTGSDNTGSGNGSSNSGSGSNNTDGKPNGNGNTPAGATPTGATPTTNLPAGSTTTTKTSNSPPASSGSGSRYIISSVALYFILFALYLNYNY